MRRQKRKRYIHFVRTVAGFYDAVGNRSEKAATTIVAASSNSGLQINSVALVFQCVAIDRRQVLEKMGRASDGELTEISPNLRS